MIVLVRFLKSSWVYLLYISFVFKVFASKLNMKVCISFVAQSYYLIIFQDFNTKGLTNHLKSGVRNDQRENENLTKLELIKSNQVPWNNDWYQIKKTSLHDNKSNQTDKGKNSDDVKNNVRSVVDIQHIASGI